VPAARPSPPGARTAVAERPPPAIAPEPDVRPEPASRSKRARKRAGRRRLRLILVAVVVFVLAAGGGVGYRMVLAHKGADHVVSAPDRLLGYVQQPAMAKGMDAQQLRADIEARGNGEASHVVDAVYEDGKSQILLFIGGNLSGSASSFISSFTGMLTNSFETRAGSLGGQAACATSASGQLAECAWADDDTFGLIASPDLTANALASELRQIRPLVEHRAR
jgi:hypothetical protein